MISSSLYPISLTKGSLICFKIPRLRTTAESDILSRKSEFSTTSLVVTTTGDVGDDN